MVSGKSAYPVGKIELEVAFGDEYNYRAEKLTFEVVKIRSPYHAKFTKVLMDGGSSINILYYETFRRMGLTDKNLS